MHKYQDDLSTKHKICCNNSVKARLLCGFLTCTDIHILSLLFLGTRHFGFKKSLRPLYPADSTEVLDKQGHRTFPLVKKNRQMLY
jgi:hypothetical protein